MVKEETLSNTIREPPLSNTIRFDLDKLKHWEFSYKKKIYKLNIKELLRLLKLVKHEKSN